MKREKRPLFRSIFAACLLCISRLYRTSIDVICHMQQRKIPQRGRASERKPSFMEGACERGGERASDERRKGRLLQLVGRPNRRSRHAARPLSPFPPLPLSLSRFLARGTLGASRHHTAPCLPPSSVVVGAFPIQSMRRPHCGDRRGPASHLACRGWTSAGEQCGGLSPRHVRGRQRPTSLSQPDMEGGEEEWAALPPSPLYLSPRLFPYVLRLLFFPAVAAAVAWLRKKSFSAQAKHGPIWLPRPMHKAMTQQGTPCVMSTFIWNSIICNMYWVAQNLGK